MILTDTDILKAIKAKEIEIIGFDKKHLGTNSYDLTLSRHLLTYDATELDCRKDHIVSRFEIPSEGIVLMPRELYLGSTQECTYSRIHVPSIEGKSSIGRLGISVHITAGFGDIGFKGFWTLEITVIKPVRVYAGMPIAQILFTLPLSNPTIPYSLKTSAKYYNQKSEPQPSQMFRNFKSELV